MIRIFAVFVVSCGVFWACTKKADTPAVQQATTNVTIKELLANSFDVGLFNEALQYTGLIDSLEGAGPYTVFAPDDAAFHLLGIDSLSQIDRMNKDSLIHLLKYHILFGQKVQRLSVDSKPNNPYVNWDGKTLYVSRPYSGDAVNNANFCVNGDTVLQADIPASNGIVHTLNIVLPYQFYDNCADYLSADTAFSFFVAGLKKFNLYSILQQGAAPTTVVAPVNDGFRAVGIDIDSINRMDTTHISALLFKIYLMTNLRYYSAPAVSPYEFIYYSPDGTYSVAYSGYVDPIQYTRNPGVDGTAYDPVTHDPLLLFSANDGNEATIGFGYPYSQAIIISQDHPAGNGVIVVIGQTLAGPDACRR